MQYYNKQDKEFDAFVKKRGYYQGRDDISMILGGCSLPWLAEYYATECMEQREMYEAKSQLFQEHFCPELKLKDLSPEKITRYAREYQDPLCMDVCFHFLDYAAKYLTDLSLMTMPFGGVYLTGSVLTEGVRFMLEDPILKDRFLEKFQNRGS